jgi:hypothetical protein
MVLRFANREKIVVGSIFALLVIAGLHLFIFSPNSRALSDAERNYVTAENRVKTLGSVKDRKDVDKYITATAEYQRQLGKLMTDLNLTFPSFYVDPSAQAIEKRRQVFTDLINQLLDLRQKSSTVKLTFLGPTGWDLPESLPEDIVRKRVNLWDLVAKLDSLDAMISIAYNPQLKRAKMEEYRFVLLQIGIDQTKVGIEGVPGTLAAYGEIVPLIKLLVHANLILKEKPEQYKITQDKLYRLLRIQFPDLVLVHYNKQLQALIDIIKFADRNKIEEISAVLLMPKTDFMKIEEEEVERPRPAAAPAVAAAERAPLERRVDSAGGEEVERALSTAVQQPAEKAKELLAVAVPIKIRISAPNLNATKFLYELANSPRTYELDDLDIWATKGGNIIADTTIDVLSFVLGLSQEVAEVAPPPPAK